MFDDYDPGILNDFGGGNVGWWMDYIRAEIDRCNEYWNDKILNSSNCQVQRVVSSIYDKYYVHYHCSNCGHNFIKSFDKGKVAPNETQCLMCGCVKMAKTVKCFLQTADILDQQDFYEVMQTYRHTEITNQLGAVYAFEQVKKFIRNHKDKIAA